MSKELTSKQAQALNAAEAEIKLAKNANAFDKAQERLNALVQQYMNNGYNVSGLRRRNSFGSRNFNNGNNGNNGNNAVVGNNENTAVVVNNGNNNAVIPVQDLQNLPGMVLLKRTLVLLGIYHYSPAQIMDLYNEIRMDAPGIFKKLVSSKNDGYGLGPEKTKELIALIRSIAAKGGKRTSKKHSRKTRKNKKTRKTRKTNHN